VGKAYLPTASVSKAGVVGKLASWTVSNFGATPDEPRELVFMVMGWSSESTLVSSSWTGIRELGTGDELWTTIDGVDADSGLFACERMELRREREWFSEVGGGDFNRGDTGQWGVESPELEVEAGFKDRESRAGSWVEADGSWGMAAE
jgi:hypothetical protein